MNRLPQLDGNFDEDADDDMLSPISADHDAVAVGSPPPQTTLDGGVGSLGGGPLLMPTMVLREPRQSETDVVELRGLELLVDRRLDPITSAGLLGDRQDYYLLLESQQRRRGCFLAAAFKYILSLLMKMTTTTQMCSADVELPQAADE